jgi:hypothetical protein
MAQKTKATSDVHSELIAIKKLLMLKLLSEGVTQAQIAATLGIDAGNLSRILPARLVKPKKNSKNK